MAASLEVVEWSIVHPNHLQAKGTVLMSRILVYPLCVVPFDKPRDPSYAICTAKLGRTSADTVTEFYNFSEVRPLHKYMCGYYDDSMWHWL